MLIEIAAGFGLLCIFEFAHILGLAMSNTVELGLSITLAPLGLLAGRPEIHNVSHSPLDGIKVRPICAGLAPLLRRQMRRHLGCLFALKAMADESVRWRLLLWAERTRDFNTRLVDRNSFRSD